MENDLGVVLPLKPTLYVKSQGTSVFRPFHSAYSVHSGGIAVLVEKSSTACLVT